MVELPPGWSAKNCAGAFTGPARAASPPALHASDGDSCSADGEVELSGLDLRPDSPGWEDVEDDSEDLRLTCLLCEATFPKLEAMLKHGSVAHEFDLKSVVCDHGLDFYGAIRLVNYVRTKREEGEEKVDVKDSAAWEDEKFLRPVLEDDAVLFCLDEIVETRSEESGRPAPADSEKDQRVAATEGHDT